MPKPRVFVSSVMDGFGECRAAARRGIVAAGAEPVMAEDFAVATASPRNACLDGVASSDVYLVIVGDRGGWKTPSGALAVEEEYDEAQRRNKIITAYIQNVPRDHEAERLATRISDYVTGHFRSSFDACPDLEMLIARNLPGVIEPLTLPAMDKTQIQRRLAEPLEIQYETTARLVIATERAEEVFDRVAIGEPAFEESVLRLAHESGFFGYRAAKESRAERDRLVVDQVVGRGDEINRRVMIESSGVVAFDAIVSSRPEDRLADGMGYVFTLVRDVVTAPLVAAFQSAGALYDAHDPFRRHQRFYYGVGFTGISHRELADAIPQRSAFSMARDLQGTLIVEESRLIGRDVLGSPADEVARIVKLLDRMIRTA